MIKKTFLLTNIKKKKMDKNNVSNIIKEALISINKRAKFLDEIPYLCRQSNCPELQMEYAKEAKRIHYRRRLFQDIKSASNRINEKKEYKSCLKEITNKTNISKYMMELNVYKYL